MSLDEIEQPGALLVRIGTAAISSGKMLDDGALSELDSFAAKQIGMWLYGNAVESMRTPDGGWVSYRVVTRDQAAADSVRAALTLTTIPHAHTGTRPADRQIRDIAQRVYGITLKDDEIERALRVVMPL